MEHLHFAIFEKLFSRQMFEFKESSFLSRQSCCRNAASVADWSIVVIQQGRLPRSILPRVKNTIENADGRILGVVLRSTLRMIRITDTPRTTFTTLRDRRPGREHACTFNGDED
jgi:hypothetical protein